MICPVGYSLDDAIYATDKSNWFVLNKESISKEKLNGLKEWQNDSKFLELGIPKINKEISEAIKNEQAIQ